MAYDLAMDVSTSDLIVQGGDLMIVDNAERVAQQVLITLREWFGEWFLKTSDGIPYLEYILVWTLHSIMSCAHWRWPMKSIQTMA